MTRAEEEAAEVDGAEGAGASTEGLPDQSKAAAPVRGKWLVQLQLGPSVERWLDPLSVVLDMATEDTAGDTGDMAEDTGAMVAMAMGALAGSHEEDMAGAPMIRRDLETWVTIITRHQVDHSTTASLL